MATSHRSTIYFESDVLRALKLKSATTDTPVSSIANDLAVGAGLTGRATGLI